MTERLTPRWDRVVLKVSGEAFAGTDGYGIDGEVVGQIAQEVVEVCSEFKVDVAVVVGGAGGALHDAVLVDGSEEREQPEQHER